MTQKPHTITIEKIVPGGFGIGRLGDGIIAFVRHVLPGEKVRIRPIRLKKSHLLAQLEQVLEPSSHRCPPGCELYGRCGGCDLQHAEAAFQLKLKEDMLRESMIRGGFSPDLISQTIKHILPAPKNFGYRQRIQLHVDDAGRLGFFHHRSHMIEPAGTCLLARPEINTVLGNLQVTPAAGKLFRLAKNVELLFNPGTSKVIVLVNSLRKPRPADRILAEALTGEIHGIDQILFQKEGHGIFGPEDKYKKPSLPPFLELTLPAAATKADELVLTWEAGGFCQVNLEQNQHLISAVLSMARPMPHDRVLDLYCGMGNFSLPLSLHAGEVTGIEGQSSGIRSAKRNVALNSRILKKHPDQSPHRNCHFAKISVPAGVRQLIQAGRKFDLIMLDPPRQGAAEIIPHLSALEAARLLYISCDPATLIRDLTELKLAGYIVSQLQPIDMFPQTHHLEIIALLERR
jgi:23S rRNA (uracil1939-C5)-methyltransferase